jgi:hypothetical protein
MMWKAVGRVADGGGRVFGFWVKAGGEAAKIQWLF